MPTVIVTTNRAKATSPELLPALSRTVAEATGKDERWVMTSLVRSEAMTYGGEDVPAAFVRVVCFQPARGRVWADRVRNFDWAPLTSA